MVKIIADSTCDLSDATLKKYDIDMLPLYIHMDEMQNAGAVPLHG